MERLINLTKFNKFLENDFIQRIISIFTKKILVFAIGFLSLIIQARVLGPEYRGLLAAILVLPNLFVVIAESGMRQSATYFIGKGELDRNKVYSTTILFFFGASLIFSLVLMLSQLETLPDSIDKKIIVLSVIGYPFLVMNSGVRGIMLGYQKTKEFGDNLLYPKIFLFILLIAFVFFDRLDLTTSVGLFTLGAILTGLFGLHSLRYIESKLSFSYFDFKILLTMLKAGFIYSVSFLFISINYKIGVIVGKEHLTSTELGNYAVSAQLVEFIWQVPAAISIVLFSKSSSRKRHDEKWNIYIQKTTSVQMYVLLVCCLLAIPIVKYVLPILIGEGYELVSDIFFIFIPGIVFMGAFKVLNVDFAGRGKPGVSLIFLPFLTIVNYFISIEMLNTFGIDGLALSVSLSYVICGLLMMIIYSKKFKLRFFKFFVF